MALVNRYKIQQQLTPSRQIIDIGIDIPNVSKRKVLLSSNGIVAAIIITALLFLAIISKAYTFLGRLSPYGSIKYEINGAWVLDDKDDKYTIYVHFHDQTVDDVYNQKLHTSSSQHGDDGDGILIVSSLGPHRVIIRTNQACGSPPIWMRVVGNSMVAIPLVRQARRSWQKERYVYWEGQFTLPIEGRYTIEERQYGCLYGKGDIKLSSYISSGGHEFEAVPALGETPTKINSQLTNSDSPLSIFGTGVWISTNNIDAIEKDKNTNSYIWANPQSVANQTLSLLNIQLNVKRGDDTAITKEVLAKEGTVSPRNGFHSFSELGNYEIVCFFGSQSAADLHSAFLAIRPLIFPQNRPFKFHYKDATSFTHPDATWSTESKVGFRKCKHILVSFDEVRGGEDSTGAGNDTKKVPLSHDEYLAQITTFINHLVKAFDETFPIWIFSVMEPAMLATNCFNTTTNGRKVASDMIQSNDHPCNILLKNLFTKPNRSSSLFPDRVRLLDNTDLSMAHWDRSEHNSVVAIVALRIFVLIGHKVKEWRSVGQRGTINGLVRNGVTEPNFKLIPYTWD